MKTKEEILMEIVKKQEELIDILTHFKHLSEPNRYFNRKHELLDEINALKSQLSKAGEGKEWRDVEEEWQKIQRPLDEPINF